MIKPIFDKLKCSIIKTTSRLPPVHNFGSKYVRDDHQRTFFTVIQQGYKGMRLSLGRSPTQLEPGLRLSIPVYHQTQQVDTRERSIPIENLQAFTSDNVPVTIEGSLFFQVKNTHDALFNISNYSWNVHNIGTSAMRSIIGTFQYDEIIADRNKINKQLQIVIGDSIKTWGIDCTRFEVQSFEPSNHGIRKQLEQQMEAERSRRKQLLDTEAAVNVADGMKRKTILESEGMLQAQKNRADGDYVQTIRGAEAHKNALILESEGLYAQLCKISEATGDSCLAAQILMEMKKIEQYKSIAQGNNNSVYFAKDGNLGQSYLMDLAETFKSSSNVKV